jgi:hypothetical protein
VLAVFIFIQYIEKNEMVRACSAYWGEERHILDFGGEI